MRSPGVLAVYLTDADDLADIADDPCFALPFPTWGICRPNIRCGAPRGQAIFFVAYHRPTGLYFPRALFVVADRITHTEAARRFAGRMNVVLASENPGPTAAWRDKWRNKKLRIAVAPDYLTSTVAADGRRWWHAGYDAHEVDNWKCARIFRCQHNTLVRCIEAQACSKEGRVDEQRYASYVVGDPNATFVTNQKVAYREVATHCGLPAEPRRTAGHKHPEDPLTKTQVDRLREWFRRNGARAAAMRR
jgi:hypothetical protein